VYTRNFLGNLKSVFCTLDKNLTHWIGIKNKMKSKLLLGLAILGLAWLQKWMQGGTCNSLTRLDGKTVVITGANTGIGKETAMDLSKRGAKIVMLCRNVEKAEMAAKEIREQSKGEVVVYRMDLASLKSVKECAENLNNDLDRIDILMNNAGVMTTPEMRTEEGFEMQMGTNHLGHFLLTNLLLPLVRKSGAGARIVILSSLAHESGQIQWEDINFNQTPYDPLAAYKQSKLANLLFAKELARREPGISVYAVHPGVVKTELFRYAKETFGPVKYGFMLLLWPITTPFLKTASNGAQTSICCAVDESIAGDSGLYYSDCKEKAPAVQAIDMQDAKRLWEISQQLTGMGE